MTFLGVLLHSYSFKDLVGLIINKIGFGSLIVLFGAYFAAIVYFSALPSKGRFSLDYARSRVVEVVSQAFYLFSFTILLILLVFESWSFLLVLFLFGINVVSMIVNANIFRADFTFEDYVRFHKGGLASIYLGQEFRGIALSWFLTMTELVAFSYVDPTIPLIGWAVILCSLAATFLQSVMALGFLINTRDCVYAKIVTVDGVLQGFVVSKGEDHYLVKTRESDLLLSSEYIKSMAPLLVSS